MQKHIIAACFITPILALLGYFAVDYMIAEQATVATRGQSYPLVAKSNCRYTSGVCTMENGDFKLSIRFEDKARMTVESVIYLTGLEISFTPSKEQQTLNKNNTFYSLDSDDGYRWRLHFADSYDQYSALQLVAGTQGSIYFGETPLEFRRYETLFNRTNFDQ